MEALQFSTVASRHFSAATSPSLSANKTISISRSLNRICSSWGGPNRSTSLSSKNLFTREVWSWVNSKTVTSRRDMRGIVRAEMFGQLTSGLEAAWNKLKGEVVKKYGSKLAKKRDLPETSRSSQQKPSFPLRFSKTLVAQSSIALFGLGFIDAGYSGDWSRIGVISKEFEDLLKMAVFAVVPFCFFIIFDISKKLEE